MAHWNTPLPGAATAFEVGQPGDRDKIVEAIEELRDSVDSLPAPSAPEVDLSDYVTRAELEGVRAPSSGIHLDSFGGTDDEKLTAAIAAQKATPQMPPIILPDRVMNFNQTRALYSGLKIQGAHSTGQKNPELAGGNYIGPLIRLGNGIGSGTSSWWVGTGNLYDIYMADFSVQGSMGQSRHQFLDQNSGTLYACEFNSLSFNFMRGVFGTTGRKCLMTQVILSGTWTLQNLWDTQCNIGGSDNSFWVDGFVNLGPSKAAVQTGGANSYMMRWDALTNTSIGYMYVNARNGWRGVLQTGARSEIVYFGGVYEGIKESRIDGLLDGPGPGTLMRIDGGVATLNGVKFGQAMDNPAPGENGLVQINGGEVNMYGCNFYGANMATANAVQHTGGRLLMSGTTKRTNAPWPNRPRVLTPFSVGSGVNSFYCPDGSVAVVRP